MKYFSKEIQKDGKRKKKGLCAAFRHQLHCQPSQRRAGTQFPVILVGFIEKAMAWYMEKIYMMALLYPFCIIAFSNKYRIFKRKDPFFFTFSVHLY